MADSFVSKLISELTEKTTAADTDLVPVADKSGNFFKMTWKKLKELMLGTKDISGVGDGTVTGAISELNTKKANKISLKTFSFGKTLRAKTVESGNILRKQLGIADNEEILFMTLEPQYVNGSGFYQGIDLSFLLVSVSGNGDNDALIYKAYNDTTSTFESVPFIVRAIVQQL